MRRLRKNSDHAVFFERVAKNADIMVLDESQRENAIGDLFIQWNQYLIQLLEMIKRVQNDDKPKTTNE